MLRTIFRYFSRESTISTKISENLGSGTQVEVTDLSGGCGTMFHIKVISPAFKGKPLILQHRMVNKCLADEEYHALRIETEAPAN